MKIRFVATATSAALLLLAACGGSESSTQDSTRTKNGALIQQTIPPINNNINNNIFDIDNCNNIVNNIQNNINNNVVTDINSCNNSNNSNITNNIIGNGDNKTNNIPSNSTPTNKTCAQGGLCAVGDTGPGGGIVFYAEQSLQPWGQYMEVSKQTIDPRFDMMWCDVAPTETFPNSDALGNGRATTEFYAKACTRGQLRIATDLVQGNYDDWHLPTLADAKQMYLVREKLQLEGQWHYTATPNLADGKKEAWAVYMVEQQSMSMNPLAGLGGRAIRTFSPTKAPSCANGDACKVGDVGPGGGIVFYAATTPQPWGQYLEVSTKTLDPRFDMMWCDVVPTEPFQNAEALGNGLATTEFYAKACKRGQLRMAADLAQGGKDDWHLPTLADLKQLYLVSKQLKIEGQWHYSATPDLANKQAVAQYMVDGQVKSMNPLAGFAGRAIRTFGPKATAPVVVAGTPTTFPAPSLPPSTQTPLTSPRITSAPPTTTPKPIIPSTLAPTTAPAIAKPTSCATGGTCKVGDTGPGNGIVFYAASTPQPWGHYLEAPTKDISTNQFWCSDLGSDIPGAGGTAIGTGKQNTADMDTACTSGAGQAAADFTFGGKDDWFLPSKDELNEMQRNKALLNMVGYYFSSSEAKPQFAWDQYMADGTPYPQGKNNGRNVRPARAFGPTGSAPQPTIAPAAVPTTKPAATSGSTPSTPTTKVTAPPTTTPKTVTNTPTTVAQKKSKKITQQKKNAATTTTVKK